MIYIGIDPGKTGAIVAIGADSRYLDSVQMPTVPLGRKRWRVNPKAVAAFIRSVVVRYGTTPPMVGFEDVGGFSAQGGQFEFGHAAGVAWAAALMTEYPVVLVRPTAWSALLPSDIGSGYARKKAIVELARERWPIAPIKTISKDSGLADALFIAEYVRRTETTA